jgi:hypothetical protein
VRKVMVGAAIAVVLTVASGATARADDDNPWRGAGLGLGAILTNVLYMPVKITYAALGSITGGE